MRQLIRAVFLLGISNLSNSVVALLRNKFLAVTLGPAGIGSFAQLAGFQTMAAGIVPLGMQTGALRYFAMYRRQDPQRLAGFAGTTFRLFWWLALGATVLCLVFLRPLSVWALDSADFAMLLLPAVLGIPFVVQAQTWLTFVQAGLDLRAYSRALMLTSALGFAVMIPLVLVWGLRGAAVHLLVFALLGYLLARHETLRVTDAATRQAMKAVPIDRQSVDHLFRFAGANLLPFALTLAFPFVVRAQIVHDLGVETNGIYQAVVGISMQFLAIPLSAMTGYSFPRISQLRQVQSINYEVNNAVRVAVLFSCACILGVLLLRDVVVRALFSDRFLDAVPLFPAQLCGDLVRAVSFAVQLPLLPQERHRARNIMSVIHYGTFAAIVFGVPAHLRLWGAIWGYTLSWIVHLVMHWLYLRRTNGFRFTPENRRLLLASFVATGAIAALPFPDLRWRLLGGAVAVAWAALSIRRREVELVMRALRARLEAAGMPGGRPRG